MCKIFVGGMSCQNCKARIEHRLSLTNGIHNISVDYLTGRVEVSFDTSETSLQDIAGIINSLGYKFLPDARKIKLQNLIGIASIIILYVLL